jgi:transcriptional regulator with XRE-family HTH domain
MPTATAADVRERWGRQLRIARVLADKSQTETGRAVGMAAPTVSKAEQGLGSIDTFDQLAKYHGIILMLGDIPAEAVAS